MTDAPKPAEIDPRDLTSFSEAGRLAEQFEQILKGHGIEIAKNSDLERVSLELMLIEGYRLGTRPEPMTDLRPMLGRAAGWVDFVKLLVRAHNDGKLGPFLEHLALLNKAHAVSQNIKVPMNDEASNKLFELFIALACLPFSEEVKLDPPNDAKGDNPDVLARVEGRLWGFACKVLNGKSPLTLYERLEEGLRQIDNSPADTGFVFVNFKNSIDHEVSWPLVNEAAFRGGQEEPVYGSWPSEGVVRKQLADFLDTRWHECIEANGGDNLIKLYTGRKSMDGAAAYMATATSITTSTGPLATIIGQLGTLRVRPIHPDGEAILDKINDVLRERL